RPRRPTGPGTGPGSSTRRGQNGGAPAPTGNGWRASSWGYDEQQGQGQRDHAGGNDSLRPGAHEWAPGRGVDGRASAQPPQQRFQGDAAPGVGAGAAPVARQEGVGTAGLLKGIGNDRQSVEGPVLVNPLGQRPDEPLPTPGRRDPPGTGGRARRGRAPAQLPRLRYHGEEAESHDSG